MKSIAKLINGGPLIKLPGSPACLWAIHWVKRKTSKTFRPKIGKIFTHGAPEKMTEVLRSQIDFPETQQITRETNKKQISGNLVLARPRLWAVRG